MKILDEKEGLCHSAGEHAASPKLVFYYYRKILISQHSLRARWKGFVIAVTSGPRTALGNNFKGDMCKGKLEIYIK